MKNSIDFDDLVNVTDEYLEQHKVDVLWFFIATIFKHCFLAGLFVFMIVFGSFYGFSWWIILSAVMVALTLLATFFYYFSFQMQKVESEIEIIKNYRQEQIQILSEKVE